MKRIKNVLALALALLMLISLSACGGNSDPAAETTKPAASNAGTEAPRETAPVPTNVTEPDDGLTVHENTFFTVGYQEEAGWLLAEDDVKAYDDGGYAYLRTLDADGYTDLLVYIEAYEEHASSFRDTLHANGVDLKAYADGSCVSETIGGMQLAAVDKQDGEWYFFGRNEAAGVSYTVHVTDWEDPNVAALVDTIRFTASGTDNIDPPWYWEGDPFYSGTLSRMIGTYTLTAQFLPMEEALITYETFDHDIAVIGDKVYLLSDCALYQYACDGDSLAFVKEIELPGEYEILEKGANGTIVLSRFMEPVYGHDGDTPQFSYDGPDKFAVAPDGTWGISWFYSGEDCELFTFQNGALTGSPFPFAELDSVSHICIDNNYILVSGYAKEDSDHYLFVYDYNGKLQLQLGDEPGGFGLGSITYATSTPNGFLALDGNMREVVLWTADGTWIGAVDDGDLFGTSYPWIAAADMAEDGSILIVMSEERADESADEVLVFRLSGF